MLTAAEQERFLRSPGTIFEGRKQKNKIGLNATIDVCHKKQRTPMVKLSAHIAHSQDRQDKANMHGDSFRTTHGETAIDKIFNG
jgi:hypothetical protein